MSTESRQSSMNGTIGHRDKTLRTDLDELTLELKQGHKYASFHGDTLIGDYVRPTGFLANIRNGADDIRRLINPRYWPAIRLVVRKKLAGEGLDVVEGAKLVGALSNDSNRRNAFMKDQVKDKYDRMLHPPLTYLGDAFQYRSADGKFNSAMHPHLGQAGAPYAKTVPSKTHPLGALPDPGDLFDHLMAREEKGGRQSPSGLSSMLIYHATIIIHDIFRTNEKDKNISDSSSYLDLSPLYGYTMEMQRKVRDDKFKLGLLKADTFAEDRLLRQPPGVCIMLVMYNRYHNYAATQLRRINENGRFSVPAKYRGKEVPAKYRGKEVPAEYRGLKLILLAESFLQPKDKDNSYKDACKKYADAWDKWMTDSSESSLERITHALKRAIAGARPDKTKLAEFETAYDADSAKDPGLEGLKIVAVAKEFVPLKDQDDEFKGYCIKYGQALTRLNTVGKAIKASKDEAEGALQTIIEKAGVTKEKQKAFEDAYDAAWDKLDDDLFNTARLITCGMFIQISIHDYLRALMGFHQFNTDFTLDPRIAMNDHKNVSRGLGNQVTVEFNLLYRFHCAISGEDEEYTKNFIRESVGDDKMDPDKMSLPHFLQLMEQSHGSKPDPPWLQEFGLKDPGRSFKRNPITGLFDDTKMIKELMKAMDDPISNFGPRNVPHCLRSVEILGILQARKWEIGTLNDFREFFGMKRHETFESITGAVEVQDALRDLYEHPDKVELYPGIFCESNDKKNLDPGPSGVDSALWQAIFSDAITLVRSDRFYTVDWNTNSLTSWGMKEVTSDSGILKSSVFNRLLQRAFPQWFPYNSIRFFHPFYTGQQNAEYAQQQGYADDFPQMKIEPRKNSIGQAAKDYYILSYSDPRKPLKPIYLDNYEKIAAVLADDSNDLIHPARLGKALKGLPAEVKKLLETSHGKNPQQPTLTDYKSDDKVLTQYFVDLCRDIVKRESITMDKHKGVYQIDITRDFAIPVTTRYIVDFLGFGHLIKSDQNRKARYSENEIYQHIENCQIFFSYNADETKLLKRRKAYRTSMNALYELTKNANVLEASRGTISQWIRSIFAVGKPVNPMTELGFKVAQEIIKHEKNSGKAAAIMLLTALDSAYNSVLAFTSVLDSFMKGLYELADPSDPTESCEWLEVQKLALAERDQGSKILGEMILEAQRISVRLPIIRVNRGKEEKCEVKNKKGDVLFTVKAGQTVICDINSAEQKKTPPAKPSAPETSYLSYQSSFTSNLTTYHPEHIGFLGLRTMVKTVAQMKNLRRGHDTQGKLKKVNLDSSSEGYSNFMAPMRMRQIQTEVEYAEKYLGRKEEDDAHDVFTTEVLKPATNTYLTPEWDEFVPFPTTWKVRFDGFGESDYRDGDGEKFSLLQRSFAHLTDHAPPFYQPQGVSKFGGTFADTVCVCNAPEVMCRCKDAGQTNTNKDDKVVMPADVTPTVSVGCGVPGG